MKGNLIKIDNEWKLIYSKPRTDHQNGFMVEQIKLHPDDVNQINEWSKVFDHIESRIASDPSVEFEITSDFYGKIKWENDGK